LDTVTALAIVHRKDVVPLVPMPLLAVSVTEYVPAVLGVPVIAPVPVLIDRPTGSPLADQSNVVGEASVAVIASGLIAAPVTDACWPGLLTVTGFTSVNDANAFNPDVAPKALTV
jgi:hypothetical protein